MTRGGKLGPVVGIDLGGTNMQIGVVDAGGAIIGRCKRKTKADLGQAAVIDRLVEGVRRACEEGGLDRSAVMAVGIGAPGAIDIPNGVVLEAPNLRWNNAPLRDLLEATLRCKVVVDNDVNVAVWGEAMVGAAKGRRHVLGVWLGTGVGGGLVLDGKLWHGPCFTAGEIGQTVITPGGPPGLLTVEDHCSRTGMSGILRKLMHMDRSSILHQLTDDEHGSISSKALAEAVRSGDVTACRVVDHAADLVGVAIANWVTVLSIDTVVVGGGVAEALGEPFLDKVRATFRRHVFPARLRDCMIAASVLCDDAGVVGAALLAQDAMRAARS
jgi:glucokinase